jgi:hypothetical protein
VIGAVVGAWACALSTPGQMTPWTPLGVLQDSLGAVVGLHSAE